MIFELMASDTGVVFPLNYLYISAELYIFLKLGRSLHVFRSF